MINPNKITNYNCSDYELEENLVFWLLVAGKTASVTARNLDTLLFKLLLKESDFDNLAEDYRLSPFDLIRDVSVEALAKIMKDCGFGCYNLKAKGLKELSVANLNLRTCTTDDLEKINGIGKKTSRCFIMHTRKNARIAGLDTHLLRFLKDLGYEVPNSTPGSNKLYKKIESQYLALVDKTDYSPAELDLVIWRVYSKHPHLKDRLLGVFRG